MSGSDCTINTSNRTALGIWSFMLKKNNFLFLWCIYIYIYYTRNTYTRTLNILFVCSILVITLVIGDLHGVTPVWIANKAKRKNKFWHIVSVRADKTNDQVNLIKHSVMTAKREGWGHLVGGTSKSISSCIVWSNKQCSQTYQHWHVCQMLDKWRSDWHQIGKM